MALTCGISPNTAAKGNSLNICAKFRVKHLMLIIVQGLQNDFGAKKVLNHKNTALVKAFAGFRISLLFIDLLNFQVITLPLFLVVTLNKFWY